MPPLFASVWGDIASILGFLLSIWALFWADNARRAVHRVQTHNHLVLLFENISQAIQELRLLEESTRRESWSRHHGGLRSALAAIQGHEFLLHDERRSVKKHLSILQTMQRDSERRVVEIRKTHDALEGIRSRLRTRVMESVK